MLNLVLTVEFLIRADGLYIISGHRTSSLLVCDWFININCHLA